MRVWGGADQPVRYLEVGNELSNRALTLSDFESHLLISSAHGYHPVAYRKYFDLGDRLGFTNINFLRLFGVRYLILPDGYAEAPPEGFLHVLDGPGGKLYYNPDISYVRAIRHMKVVDTWADVLDRLAEPGFNPYESTTILSDEVSPANRGRKPQVEPFELNARVIPQHPGQTLIRCESRVKGYIAISEPDVPGWRLTVDGVRADNLLIRTDGYFLGAFLPAGKHDLVLTYDPVSQRLGLFLTLLTLGLCGLWLGRRIAIPRRAKTTATKLS